VDGAELEPHPRVAREGLHQRLHLALGLAVAAELDQQVAQALHEGRVLRVGLERLLVDRDRLLQLVLRLVDEAQGGPRPVVIGSRSTARRRFLIASSHCSFSMPMRPSR
jgi:hypothetical protein